MLLRARASNPVLTIKRGLALNREGQTLWVQNDVELAIVRSSESVAASGKVFSDCAPSASSVSVSGDGVYLLVIAPAKEKEGKAPVSGLGNVPAACNSRYTTIGVQFRLVPLNLDPVSSSERARNEARLPVLRPGGKAAERLPLRGARAAFATSLRP